MYYENSHFKVTIDFTSQNVVKFFNTKVIGNVQKYNLLTYEEFEYNKNPLTRLLSRNENYFNGAIYFTLF